MDKEDLPKLNNQNDRQEINMDKEEGANLNNQNDRQEINMDKEEGANVINIGGEAVLLQDFSSEGEFRAPKKLKNKITNMEYSKDENGNIILGKNKIWKKRDTIKEIEKIIAKTPEKERGYLAKKFGEHKVFEYLRSDRRPAEIIYGQCKYDSDFYIKNSPIYTFPNPFSVQPAFTETNPNSPEAMELKELTKLRPEMTELEKQAEWNKLPKKIPKDFFEARASACKFYMASLFCRMPDRNIINDLRTLITQVEPKIDELHFGVEVGSMVGLSALKLAMDSDEVGLDYLPILAIDPFQGDLNMWTNRDSFHATKQNIAGRTLIYDNFVTNLKFAYEQNYTNPFHIVLFLIIA